METNYSINPIFAPIGATGYLVDVKGGTLKLQFGSEQAEFSMKHASHLPNILEQCHAMDVVDKSVFESQKELQPKEPEVQVFVTADNSNPEELFGITLCSDISGSAENASRAPSDASREMLREGLPYASRGKFRGSRALERISSAVS